MTQPDIRGGYVEAALVHSIAQPEVITAAREQHEWSEALGRWCYRSPVEAWRYIDPAGSGPLRVSFGPGWLGRLARRVAGLVAGKYIGR